MRPVRAIPSETSCKVLTSELYLHKIIALQILHLALQHYTNDSVKLAIEFLKDCGQTLPEAYPQQLDPIFLTLDNLLHDQSLNRRI
ncbi:unnamed protein product [Rotaria socialis]|uniref:Uncharacterized protein n=1 Tax=Rotaria socialis TaxID=392032 RepID=A0A821B0A1_9BILA|nr:unnamed protein product [Rotaria socialis]CAF4588477.1 unnamed protein product [Rotaria socialis]CAF4818880.1 unnamed protein product [Rotaria socialis]